MCAKTGTKWVLVSTEYCLNKNVMYYISYFRKIIWIIASSSRATSTMRLCKTSISWCRNGTRIGTTDPEDSVPVSERWQHQNRWPFGQQCWKRKWKTNFNQADGGRASLRLLQGCASFPSYARIARKKKIRIFRSRTQLRHIVLLPFSRTVARLLSHVQKVKERNLSNTNTTRNIHGFIPNSLCAAGVKAVTEKTLRSCTTCVELYTFSVLVETNAFWNFFRGTIGISKNNKTTIVTSSTTTNYSPSFFFGCFLFVRSFVRSRIQEASLPSPLTPAFLSTIIVSISISLYIALRYTQNHCISIYTNTHRPSWAEWIHALPSTGLALPTANSAVTIHSWSHCISSEFVVEWSFERVFGDVVQTVLALAVEWDGILLVTRHYAHAFLFDIPIFVFAFLLCCSLQIRKEIRSRPGIGMDARPSDCSHHCGNGLCDSHFWWPIPHEGSACLEFERPHGPLEFVPECLFLDWHVSNPPTIVAQSLLFESSWQFVSGSWVNDIGFCCCCCFCCRGISKRTNCSHSSWTMRHNTTVVWESLADYNRITSHGISHFLLIFESSVHK